ncbi:MAG: hypothetical protein V4503_05430 [Gemmatimonadota bacterium]
MNLRISTLLVVTALAAACSSTASLPDGGEAQFGLLNALAAGETATLSLDGTALALPASGARSTKAIPAGAHRLEARTSTGSLLGALDFTASEGSRSVTVVARSGPDALALLMTADTASVPPLGGSKIRVIHAADGVEPLKAWLRLAGTPMDSGAGFLSPFLRGAGSNPEFPGYAVRPPGSYLVTGTSLATGETLVENAVQLAANEVWSAILTRTTTGGLEFQMVREK